MTEETFQAEESVSLAGFDAVLTEERGCDIPVPILERESGDFDSVRCIFSP